AAVDASLGVRARLARLGEAYVGFALAEPHSYRIMFELRDPAEEHPEVSAEAERSFSYLHAAVTDAVAAGALHGDPRSLANLLWAQAHGLVSLHLTGKLVGRSLEELLATLLAPPPQDRS